MYKRQPLQRSRSEGRVVARHRRGHEVGAELDVELKGRDFATPQPFGEVPQAALTGFGFVTGQRARAREVNADQQRLIRRAPNATFYRDRPLAQQRGFICTVHGG